MLAPQHGRGLPALCGRLEDLDLPPDSVECISAFDVIEHIPLVSKFLSEVHRVLVPGGVVMVTVPALSMLWGDEDDFAGHQRRYTKAQLVSEFEACGFVKLHTEYLYASLVTPAALTTPYPTDSGDAAPKPTCWQAFNRN